MMKRVLKGLLVALAVAVLVGIGLAGYYLFKVKPLIRSGKQQGVYAAVAARPSVTGFHFETLEGTRKSIAHYKGRILVVDVWATWCSTCIASIPHVVALADRYADRPVEIIGLNVDEEGWAKVKPFLQRHPEIKYAMAVPNPAPSFLMQSIVDLNPLGEVAAIPTVFVIDRHGRLAGKFIESGHEEEIDDLVARLLDETP